MRKLTLLLLFLLTSAIALSQDYYFDSVLSYDDENETVLYNYYSRVSLTPHKDHDIEVKLDGNKVIKYNMIYKETEGVHNGVKFVEYRMLALDTQTYFSFIFYDTPMVEIVTSKTNVILFNE